MNDEPGGMPSSTYHINIGHVTVMSAVTYGLFLFKHRGKTF